MNTEEPIQDFLMNRCVQHLAHAREKHPKFVENVSCWPDEDLQTSADHYREALWRACSLEYAMLSELYEFLYELRKNPKSERTLEEAADLVALILRAILSDMERPSDVIESIQRKIAQIDLNNIDAMISSLSREKQRLCDLVDSVKADIAAYKRGFDEKD